MCRLSINRPFITEMKCFLQVLIPHSRYVELEDFEVSEGVQQTQ
jgi:hypothetical protein